jgi:outer membrane protein assembly factor BamE (lipoprotein component of BamABCDE complex)
VNIKKKNNLNWKYIFTLFSLMTLISCGAVQVGQDFKLQTFSSQAELGKTNKAQVLKWLGKPMSTGISQKADGERLDEWDYFYGTGQLPGMKDTKLKILQIRFDKNGLLRSYNWTGSK